MIRRAKFVYICQDVFPQVALVLGFKNKVVSKTLEHISRFLLRRARIVVAIGETMKQRLVKEKQVASNKIRVIHNWADCAAIQPQSQDNEFSRTHDLAGKFVVMHSGNVGLSQSLETLIEAARVLRSHEEMHFVIIGDGVRRFELAQAARGLTNVRFLPYQPAERLSLSFSAASVFVVSLKKGLAGYIVPSKVYGILAAGRPFVAAVEESSEAAEIAKKYGCGLICRPQDPEDLAKKLLSLFQDPELAKKMGNAAREAALQFDRPGQVEAYYNLFREITSV